MRASQMWAALLAWTCFTPLAASTRANEPERNTTSPVTLAAPTASGVILATVNEWPATGQLALPTPQPNITRAYLLESRDRRPLLFEFNPTATSITLHLPSEKPRAAQIVLETAEHSSQWPDGRIVLSALDAQVMGQTAQLETHPGNHRIGFWSNMNDFVQWKYEATRPGNYTVELTYAVAGGEGTEFEVALGEQKLAGKLVDTDSYYKYTSVKVGGLRIPAPGQHTLTVRGTKKTGGAVMNLKALTLRPASEGQPIVQADDGSVTCHARDVIIHGVKVQWEPKPEKQTVGYWVNASDTVSWEFTAAKPGEYEVEILQGCGKNSGGSEVELAVAGQALKFVVEDTGHFQNFVPRKIGRVKLEQAGLTEITVKPLVKKGAAIMDLRQVRLLPVTK